MACDKNNNLLEFQWLEPKCTAAKNVKRIESMNN